MADNKSKKPDLPYELPWYTKGLMALMGKKLQRVVDWDEKGKISKVSKHAWSPYGIQQAYNIFIDETGFNPDMVNRWNLTTKAIPKETLHYAFTGDVSPGLQKIRKSLLDIYFDKESKKHEDLIDSVMEYEKKADVYTDEGEKWLPKGIKSGLLNPENLIDIFEKKYKEKWYGKKN
tara:strand:- start:29 stop:556 length:528 start_codon:yes stop_codon:yes gene_type:complete